jgi:hypothetical protein
MKRVVRTSFVAILLLTAGTRNIPYGISALSNAHFFENTQYVSRVSNTWGESRSSPA